MPHKQRLAHKKRKVGRRLVGGVRFEEGFFDDFNHILKKDLAPYHVKEMEEKKAHLENQLQSLKEDYNVEAERLHDAKIEYNTAQKEERDRAFQKELTQMGIDAGDAQLANQTSKDFWTNVKWFFNWLWDGIPRVWHGTGVFLSGVGSTLNGIFNGNLTKVTLIFILSILFLIAVIIILGFLIAGIVKSGSSNETSESDKATQEQKNGKCSRTVQGSAELDSIAKFGESLQKNLNDAIISSLQYIKDKQAEYAKMTTISDFSKMIGDPLGGIREIFAYSADSIANNDYIKAIYLYTIYFYYAITSYITGLLGNRLSSKFNQTEPRDTSTGRNDGINNINTSIFSKPLMRTKGIDTSKNAVVNISTPENITWTLSDTEYDGLDIDKIPPTLLKFPDKKNNNITINDKREIVIPWITKDKYYVLSCENAYFKNNPREKANLLIDNYENNTCTYDLSSRVEQYSTPKTRHRYTNDLSQFL